MDMLAPQDPLDVRIWNGTPISRRTTDGYVNATAMCKANGKQWN
jgi:formylmethanofuran dehydrogenase subunit D